MNNQISILVLILYESASTKRCKKLILKISIVHFDKASQLQQTFMHKYMLLIAKP